MTSTYILFIFICAKNTTKNAIRFKNNLSTKLCKYFPDFLGLTSFLRLEETVDLSKLLKFGRTCSNWQDAIGMNTKKGEAQTSKQLQNIFLQQIWHTAHGLLESYQQKSQRDMKGHDSRVLYMNLHKSLSSLNYPEPNIDKIHKIKTS